MRHASLFQSFLRVIFDGDLVNEIKTFDTISQRSVSEKKDILIVPATELFQINARP